MFSYVPWIKIMLLSLPRFLNVSPNGGPSTAVPRKFDILECYLTLLTVALAESLS